MISKVFSTVVLALALAAGVVGAQSACADDSLSSANAVATVPDAARIEFRWGVKIPLRDNVRLNATVYLPRGQKTPAPCVFTLTPYIAETYHERGIYFAAHGFPFLVVDARGRGNSEGEFRPFIHEGKDGYDVVEWLAKQPYCNGKVTMWGGSYAGYDQWATAREFPPHLATIVPVAAPYMAVDAPLGDNMFSGDNIHWHTLVTGRAVQFKIYGDDSFWAAKYQQWFESGRPFKEIDAVVGNPSPLFQEDLAHPTQGSYWDQYNPTSEQYARLGIPILTITGSYDGDQAGALNHYREYMKSASSEGRARHYLIIGPWDHAGTRTPKLEVGGLKFGEASLVDLPDLHCQWYSWTMQDGPKPAFLKSHVAYYVMGAETWRYADTLDDVTKESVAYFLDSNSNPTDPVAGGFLRTQPAAGTPDHYMYDPRDVSTGALEASLVPGSLIDQRMIYAQSGKELIYYTAPFERNTEVSGFFRLSAWLAIDQPDTDFSATVYELRLDGSSILLATGVLRARYRESLRQEKLITTREPLRYDFNHFTFVSRQIAKGSRLRLVVGPINSIYLEKNYNSGGEVAAESMKDARPVIVKLYHDHDHPSALYVPFGRE